jgi:hypothetical protein
MIHAVPADGDAPIGLNQPVGFIEALDRQVDKRLHGGNAGQIVQPSGDLQALLRDPPDTKSLPGERRQGRITALLWGQ